MLQQFPSVQVKETYFCITQLQNHMNLQPQSSCPKNTLLFLNRNFRLQTAAFIAHMVLQISFHLKLEKCCPEDFIFFIFFFFKIVSALLTTRAQNYSHFPKQRYFPSHSKALYFLKQSQARSQQSDMPKRPVIQKTRTKVSIRSETPSILQ